MSAIACSIKGDVKEHFSPCTGAADIFRDIQLSDHGRRLRGVVPWVVLFHISEFFWLRQRGTVSETEQARWLYRCQPWFYLRLGA